MIENVVFLLIGFIANITQFEKCPHSFGRNSTKAA